MVFDHVDKQLALFVLHNVLTDHRGYMLLQCLCSYCDLDMHTSLQVHLSSTLASGREALQDFSKRMKVCLIHWEEPIMILIYSPEIC